MREACLRQLPSSIFESAPEVITVSTNPAPGQPFDDPKSTWNRRFDSPDYVFGTQPNDWLKRKVQAFAAGGRILCVADGEGRNSVWLAAQGYQVDAFDISDRGVAKAKQLADNAGVHVNFTVAGCDEFVWPKDTYEGVAAIFIQFADPAMRSRIFSKMIDSLKPGGVLILQGYSPKQLEYKTGGPGVLSHLYTEELLKESLGQLKMVELTSYDAELNEGAGHRGRSALIGVVATKAR